MIKLLHSLINGMQIDDLDSEQAQKLNELVAKKIVKKSHKFYKLSDKYKFGKLDVSSAGTGYLQTYGDKIYKKDLLIEQKNLNGALKGDIVIAKMTYNKTSRPKAKVIQIIKRANSHVVVYTKTIQKRVVGINVKTLQQINITASAKSLKQLPENTVLKINNETSTIEEVLGVLSDDSVDEKISLALFNKVEEFGIDAQNEAQSYGTIVDKTLHEDYEDLTHLPFCTIDPPDAKDFDDAIYFDKENNALYVAIADVSSYVHPFGHLDKEAKQRGFSIYFPHKSIPMLPRTLSENICSLKPDEDRLAFGFKIVFDKNSLKIEEEKLLKMVINSKRRFSYDEIDAFLQNRYENPSSVDKLIFSWLPSLKELTDRVRKKRLHSAFEFRSSEVRMQVDENQHLISTKIEKETASHALIEDCMLQANKAAAKLIEMGIFRNHQSPSFERIEELLVDLEMIGLTFNFSQDLPKLIKDIQTQADELNIREDVDKLIIKSQKKAVYEAQNRGHFGLGFDKYTHFTSPIRRYSDLILHRLLKAKLANDEKLFNYQLENIDEVCENISDLERESDKVAWDYMDRKFARWAASHIGEEFEVVVTDVGRNVITKLDDTLKGARIFLLDDDVELLERLKVKIVEANIANGMIFAKISQRLDL